MCLDDTIHPEVVKLYPDARPPRFRFEDPAPGMLVMHYTSERRLCAMAEGMTEVERANRRADRERRARLAAEEIAERATRELYDTVRDLREAEARARIV